MFIEILRKVAGSSGEAAKELSERMLTAAKGAATGMWEGAKISLATSTSGSDARAYRYGYGVLDENQNLVKDPGEKKVYFEFSDYSTSYIFYENPHG